MGSEEGDICKRMLQGECTLTPRAKRKLEQIIEGARRVFAEQGFGGASVDDIAQEAGTSKATMYRYFPDKAAIFSEVVRQDFARQAELMAREPEDSALEPFLLHHARRYVELLTTPFMQDMYRAAVAESARTPDYGLSFFESGPDKGRRWLAPVLRVAADRGEIAVENENIAARQFFALCAADVFYQSLFGVRTFTRKELDQAALVAVTTFLKAHAVEGKAGDKA